MSDFNKKELKRIKKGNISPAMLSKLMSNIEEDLPIVEDTNIIDTHGAAFDNNSICVPPTFKELPVYEQFPILVHEYSHFIYDTLNPDSIDLINRVIKVNPDNGMRYIDISCFEFIEVVLNECFAVYTEQKLKKRGNRNYLVAFSIADSYIDPNIDPAANAELVNDIVDIAKQHFAKTDILEKHSKVVLERLGLEGLIK